MLAERSANLRNETTLTRCWSSGLRRMMVELAGGSFSSARRSCMIDRAGEGDLGIGRAGDDARESDAGGIG